ncbi:MAG: tRNA preQ1(34) S-adenosylmethionine ribosyltransferase-isomerase QueA [Patescibacteria group bacterium]
MKTSLFDYHLPHSRIAQSPASPRDSSRLLVFNRTLNTVTHDRFNHLPAYVQSGDVLVFNDTKVFPARLFGKKETGGRIEVFLLRPVGGRTWEVLIGGKVRRVGMKISFNLSLRCEAVKRLEAGMWQVRFNKAPKQVSAIADKIGSTPTPPYIKKLAPMSVYQTVYAKKIGSVAAPTAGFHFTKRLLAGLKKKGVQFEYVTLHVGLGTFQPVKVENIEKHRMHAEYAEISKNTLNHLRQAKKEGRRIIAVGTTSVRVLETIGSRKAGYKGLVNTFIYPGYRFRMVDAMITNFHLPKSTLLMLVSAFAKAPADRSVFAGLRKILGVYKIAIRKKYQFYSFGDGMLLT